MSYGQYSQNNNNPYSQGPSAEAGYGGNQDQYEMQSYGQDQQQHQQQPPSASSHAMSQNDFLNQVQFTRGEIRALTADVQSVAGLHQRSLTGDETAHSQLEALVAETSRRSTSIRSLIKTLKSDVEVTTDPSLRGMKTRQWTSLNDDFKSALQSYLDEESRYKQRYREQISRQYLIANPGATEEEARQAADQDWSNEGVFQQALRQNRAAQGAYVLGNVRARHNELKEIERQMVELAAMFEDLDTLVIQQAPLVEQAEQQADVTVTHLKAGNEEVTKGARLAKHRRKLKWYCVLVVVLIVVALAIGLGVGITAARTASG